MKRNQIKIDGTYIEGWNISGSVNKLKRKEYRLKFRREATCLYCFQLNKWIMPQDFIVDEYYYFENKSNPDAERIICAISLLDGLKGFLIDACNIYSDNISLEMAQKLKLNN